MLSAPCGHPNRCIFAVNTGFIRQKGTVVKERVYPIIFTLRDLVYGDGFVAGVTTRGRAVMECDEGDWCAAEYSLVR